MWRPAAHKSGKQNFGTSSAFRGWIRREKIVVLTTKPGVPRQGLGFWSEGQKSEVT